MWPILRDGPRKSAVADLRSIDCRSRVNPRSVGLLRMTLVGVGRQPETLMIGDASLRDAPHHEGLGNTSGDFEPRKGTTDADAEDRRRYHHQHYRARRTVAAAGGYVSGLRPGSGSPT